MMENLNVINWQQSWHLNHSAAHTGQTFSRLEAEEVQMNWLNVKTPTLHSLNPTTCLIPP